MYDILHTSNRMRVRKLPLEERHSVQFALLLKSHANARYAQSIQKLAAAECKCLLFALNAKTDIHYEMLAGNPFLMLTSDGLGDAEWKYLARHSSLSFAAVRDGEWLKPLQLDRPAYLPPDLAQVLKYKGKTNTDFTVMMLNCARSASAFALAEEPLTVLDPLCGRGTTAFCALTMGDHAIGLEADEKALHEADAYLERYLQYHRLKHCREQRSITLRGGGAMREIRYSLADSVEHYRQGRTISCRWILGDTAAADEAAGQGGCHLIAGDLPYGVQHSPRGQRGYDSLDGLLQRAVPSYYRALIKGGALALSFNTYTLPRENVARAFEDAGFQVMGSDPFNDFSHWVEQAVNRDMVIGVKR
jgi:hypothetical protein